MMIDLENQKTDFRRAANLAGWHMLLNFGLMYYTFIEVGEGHAVEIIWMIAIAYSFFCSLSLYSALAYGFHVRTQSGKWNGLFYSLLVIFLICVGVTLWALVKLIRFTM